MLGGPLLRIFEGYLCWRPFSHYEYLFYDRTLMVGRSLLRMHVGSFAMGRVFVTLFAAMGLCFVMD